MKTLRSAFANKRLTVHQTMILIAVCIGLGLAAAGGIWLRSAARAATSPGGSSGLSEPGNQASQSRPPETVLPSETTDQSETADQSDATQPPETARPFGTTQPAVIGPVRSFEIRPIMDSDRPDAKVLGIRVSKLVQGQVAWTYDDHAWTERSYGVQAIETRSGIYVFGSERRTEWNAQGQGTDSYQGRVVFLSHEGKRLWQQVQESGTNRLSYDQAIVEAQDDSLVIFGSTGRTEDGRPDSRFVTVWKFSASGKLMWRRDNPVDQYREVRQAVPFAGQYLVRLEALGDDSELVSIARTGELLRQHDLAVGGRRCFVEDILPVGDQALLSCMSRNAARPEFERQVVELLNQIPRGVAGDGLPLYEQAIPEPYQSTLLEIFRQAYAAALLSLDPAGAVTVIHVEADTRAGKLALADGMLSQQLFRIDSVRRAYAGSHRIVLLGQESIIRLDADGRIVAWKPVGEYRSRW